MTMGIRVIAFGMVIVLIALFVLAKLYAKKSQEKNRSEAIYAEIIFHFKEKGELGSSKCLRELMDKLHITEEQANQMLTKDKLI